jgi:hypothetical protein
MCMSQRAHKDADDLTPCRMLLETPGGLSCDDLGFEVAGDRMPMSGWLCELPQLRRTERGREAAATGWYVAGPPLAMNDACLDAGAEQRAALNGELPALAVPQLQCAEAYAEPANVSAALRTGESVQRIAPDSCSSLPPLPSRVPTDIGAVCATPFVPPGGFYNDRIYVEVRSEQCETGICLVDATSSSERAPCPAPDARCVVGLNLLGDYTYCSCRCETNGDTSRAPCTCPSGYSCRTTLGPEAPPSLAGGYCMRDDDPPGPVLE